MCLFEDFSTCDCDMKFNLLISNFRFYINWYTFQNPQDTVSFEYKFLNQYRKCVEKFQEFEKKLPP